MSAAGYLFDDRRCFVCGPDNLAGLRLTPVAEAGVCRIAWTPGTEHQGYAGILHGGLAALLMDEAMAYAARSAAGNCATAEMRTRFLRPIRTTRPLEVEAEVVSHRHGVLSTEARLHQEGALVARASARFVPVSKAELSDEANAPTPAPPE